MPTIETGSCFEDNALISDSHFSADNRISGGFYIDSVSVAADGCLMQMGGDDGGLGIYI
jgi:hypothetical protein